MVDVQTVSIAIASASVVVGVVYYALELRHQNRIRQTDLVMKLYSQFDSLEFQKVYEEVLNREPMNYYDYEKKYGWAEATAVGMFFEGIGILLHRKLVDIELVDDMFTSHIKWTWEKYKDITYEGRKLTNQPEIYEWFEYLYNEMKKREQKLQSKP
ncbi:MAG TPA: hypothetical protein VMT26_05240 [Candidatus Bathyarchaeia archaeon]|jgi:hypothetical protein|nr:hypothetical protein [Candidatus Bathyarchaeia archaeon]